MTVNVFSVPVFFVVFRETLEVAVIVSVLFASLKQTLSSPDPADYRKLCKQVRLMSLITHRPSNSRRYGVVHSWAFSSA